MKKHFDKSQTKDRPKMTVAFYEKAFESFVDMVKELKTLHPEFCEIFNNPEEEMNAEWAIFDALSYFNNNSPVINERKNLPVSINITSNKVALKTNKYFSIEWTFKYDKDANISNLVATIGTFTKLKNSDELNAMIEILNNTWSVKVIENKARA